MSLQDNRRRQHEEPHERTIERQILDALLRIEELLIGDSVRVEGDVTDLITQITPTKTPSLRQAQGASLVAPVASPRTMRSLWPRRLGAASDPREPTGPRVEDRGSQIAASV